MKKLRVGVAHGAIVNAGDFLIYERGMRLLERWFADKLNIEWVEIKRWEPFYEKNLDLDAMVILGGPLVSRKLHSQAFNIYRYLQRQQSVPVIVLGVGISGEDYESPKNYFVDEDSIAFWKYVFRSSHLISVRDVRTYEVFDAYGINAYLTGCPALYSKEVLWLFQRVSGIDEILTFIDSMLSSKIDGCTVCLSPARMSKRRFLLNLYYVLSSWILFYSCDVKIIFQHGITCVFDRILASLCSLLGMEVLDGAGQSIERVCSLSSTDVYIGPRLHAGIFFLSEFHDAYFYALDNRITAFADTIGVSSHKFDLFGIISLLLSVRKVVKRRRMGAVVRNVVFRLWELYNQGLVPFMESVESLLLKLR